ncbi:phage minor head protein [Angustibacter sp. McL0619]|uniref:phage minor head protein n=1 Tax=Angustibacter sp. McL0619 TaxID=3415676 RepID=UPI003CF80F53
MAARRETLRLLGQLRIILGQTVDAATQQAAYSWARAWNVAVREWEDAALALALVRDDGKWPTRTQIAREDRAQRALTVTRALLNDASRTVGFTVIQSAGDALHAALAGRPDLVGSQLPGAVRTDMQAAFNVVNARQVEAIVHRTSQRIEALTRPLSADAVSAMYDQLIRGVLVGANPRDAAAAMVEQVKGAFDGGLTRANVIARTEILDAHRAGGASWERANTAVLGGWQWVAQLDKRTCPSCWAQHGSEHPVDEDGPNDHQQGRCARLPITKPWSQLGFNIAEPPSLVPDGQARFAALSDGDQLAVMGPQRLELLQSGQVSWADLSQRRSTDGWRDSFAPTPVKDLPATPTSAAA